MPRITEEYRATRRTEILQAAARCFAKDGFHASSMADIITESGLSAGAVYRYFKSKEDIIGGVADRTLAIADQTFAELLADGATPSPADAVARTIERIVGGGIGGPDLGTDVTGMVMQVWGEALRNPALGDRVNDAYRQLRAHCAEVVRRWRDAGNLPPDTVPEQVGAVMLGLTQGFLVQHMLMRDLSVPDYLAGLHALLSSALPG